MGIRKRIDVLSGKAGIVKIIPPLQKASDLIQIHQYAHDPVSGGWHGEKPVRNVHSLRAAVIGPEPRNAMVDKRLNMIVRRDRMLHQPLFIKGVIAERIDYHPSLQQILHASLRCGIALQIPFRRLVRDMKIHVLSVISNILQFILQSGKEFLQKLPIIPAARRNMPAKALLQPSSFQDQDLRRRLRPPLGKQMGHLQIFDPVSAAQGAPSFQPAEIKMIPFPVL